MSDINEKGQGRKPGRPRKYEGGRINATVRFTPERYADLKAEADRNGRSISEEVEYRIEQYATLQDALVSSGQDWNSIFSLSSAIHNTPKAFDALSPSKVGMKSDRFYSIFKRMNDGWGQYSSCSEPWCEFFVTKTVSKYAANKTPDIIRSEIEPEEGKGP